MQKSLAKLVLFVALIVSFEPAFSSEDSTPVTSPGICAERDVIWIEEDDRYVCDENHNGIADCKEFECSPDQTWD